MKFFKAAFLIAIMTALLIAQPAGAQDGSDQKRHPNYNMLGRDASGTMDPTTPLNPNFVASEESKLKEGGFWRSSYINDGLVGMVVEDIDGDGQNEIVYAGQRTIYVTRFMAGKLQLLAKHSLVKPGTIVSLDAMDLNGNRQKEIICSIQGEKTAASAIFSFTGSSLETVAADLPWYLRVVGPADGRFLAGQKPSTQQNHFYNGSVMRMSLKGNKVVSQGQVGLPPFVNLFNFTIGRIGSGNNQLVAAIKFPSEHIHLFEGTNQVWESKEEYGGTMNYLVPPNQESTLREYLPSRLILADIDGDGRNELIVAKNDRSGVAFMSRLRSFSGGALQAFKYTNMSLSPFFRTRSLPGSGVDYALADYNNDGSLDLVVAVVMEEKSGMLKDGRSVIIAYEISRP
ncbi:VCBS repeat-containing protein [Deltaproteobacteria bacterium OttesenSCG-928-K17]|nr:VCBS repeat-containing protein [Deltaproteobacteria bacterium OttesenSCG-928-K17]